MRKGIIAAQGFALTEALVAMGVLSVVILAALYARTTLFKSVETSDASQSQSDISYLLGLFLSDAKLCNATLSGLTAPSADSPTSVTLPALLTGSRAFSQVTLSSVQLREPKDVAPQTYRARLIITGSKTIDGFGSKSFTQETPVYYSTSGATISSCLTVQQASGNCVALGGNWETNSSGSYFCNFCAALGGTWDSSRSRCKGI